MTAHRFSAFNFLVVLTSTFLASHCEAADPGLPFTEDFANTNLRNATETTANWSTNEQVALLKSRGPIYGAFGPGLAGANITDEVRNTTSLALGDMDGDGDLDLVTGSRNQTTRLYFNDGLTFPKTIPTGFDITSDARDTFSVAVGDMDGDGDLDVVTGNFDGPNRLYLNNGMTVPFSAVVGTDITSDADSTAAVALGDMDGDGDLDLVAANNGTPSRLYLNNGSSDPFDGVTSATITSDAFDTNYLALGDLDSDGDLDVVVGNLAGPSRFYLNNGTAAPFEEVMGRDFAADSTDTGPVALGDVNGDGNLDIVTGGTLGGTEKVYFHNGTENPFEGESGLPIGVDMDSTYSLALGDVDCDGDLDVVSGNAGIFISGVINRLHLNNGTSEPFASVMGTNLSDDTDDTYAVGLGDVDGDGDLDAVAGNFGAANRLYLNEGTPNPFGGGSDIISDTISARDMAVGDVDADGDLDIALGNAFLGGIARLALNNGTGAPFSGMAGSEIATDSEIPYAVELRDFNGDGGLDLALTTNQGAFRLYLNNNSSDPFAGVQGQLISSDSFPSSDVVSGDVDLDGDIDLVAAELLRNSVFLNNGSSDPFSGVVASKIGFATQFVSIQFMALGDLDGDGAPDLLLGTGPGQLDQFHLNNGTSEPFAQTIRHPLGTATGQTTAVALGDVDGDGDLDILTSGLEGVVGRGILLYPNNGSRAPFEGVSEIRISPDLALSFAVGDVDGDGDLDVLFTNDGIRERLLLNNGTSNPFAGVENILVSNIPGPPRSLALADFNRDGNLDLAAGGSSGRPCQLYLNNQISDPMSLFVSQDIAGDGSSTRSVVVGDVDGDGDPDVVAGNFGQSNRLYLNNGKMEPFEDVEGTDITADARQTTAVGLSDLDKDGDLDLVAGNSGLPNRFYPNNGGESPFEGITGVNITADSRSTTSVAIGDIDRDGDEDLVAGNFGQPNRMYLNNGTSNPWNGVSGENITDDAHNTNSVALGDVDRNGFLDVVAGNFGQPNRLYLNQLSTGPFSAGHEINPATFFANAMAVGDMDGDNDLDLVIAKGFMSPRLPARLHLNNGTPDPFAGVAGTEITPATRHIIALALGDVDGDQDLDLVSNSLSESMQLYLNNGTSAPFNGVAGVDITSDTQGVGSLSRPIALGDMDGDEDLDIVESPGVALPLRLYLNNGSVNPFAGVASVNITSDTGYTTSLALADFNGDGDLDIAASNADLNEPNRLYLNNGTLNPFQGVVASDITSDSDFTLSLSAGDLNGDSRPDLVAGNNASPSLVYLNNGTANPFAGVSGSTIYSTTLASVISTALGDVDADEDLDVILGFNPNDPNQLFLNNGGSDPFDGVTGIAVDSNNSGTANLLMGDMDGDGDLDLVLGSSGGVDTLLLNNLIPNPFLSGSDITSDADNTNSVALGDINLDGYLDVVAGNFNQQNRWYRNNRTDNPFEGVTGFNVGAEATNTEEVALADVNRDGRLDLITGNLGQPNRVYLHVDNTVPQPSVEDGFDITSDADNTRSVVAFDMDRDGSLDIVAGNDGQPNRLYTRHRFNTSASIATSLTVDTKPDNIHRIILDTEETLAPNTGIDYWVSANGGARWSLVRPERLLTFLTPGSDLRWRAVLRSLSPQLTPRLETLFLDLGPGINAIPARVDFQFRVPNSGPSDPTTVTIVNEGDVDVIVSGVFLGGPDSGEFQIFNDSGEINLGPAETRTFDVTFNPTSLGLKTAMVTVTSDDLDRGAFTVELEGVGGTAPTPTPTRTLSPTNTPLIILLTPTPSLTPISTLSPTPLETIVYDIHPEPPDGFVDAGDLLEWLARIHGAESDRGLLFDFARFWQNAP